MQEALRRQLDEITRLCVRISALKCPDLLGNDVETPSHFPLSPSVVTTTLTAMRYSRSGG